MNIIPSILILDTHDVLTMAVADTSFYPSTAPSGKGTLEVTPPDMPKKSFQIEKSGSIVLRGFDMGFVCEDECYSLPDGIYTVSFTPVGGGEKVTKRFLRIEWLKVLYQETFLLAEDDCSCHKSSDLMCASVLIEGALAAHANCDLKKALGYYTKAEQILNAIKNK